MKKINTILSLLASLSFFIFCISSAQATLIANDDPIWGTGSTITDTATGLTWLKPSKTVNQSYSQVSSKLGFGDYENLRYATNVEVVQLFNDAGIPQYTYGNTNGWHNTNAFVTLFGPTYSQTQWAAHALGVSGLMSSTSGDQVLYANAQYGWMAASGFFFYEDALKTIGITSDSYASLCTGSWLILDHNLPEPNTPVPEPSTFILLAVGFAGVGFLWRRAKK
jgi:hypothetical protein